MSPLFSLIPKVGYLAMDRISRAVRSRVMSRIRSKDTGPEMAVRRLVHGMGYRYRLHSEKLPGRPDLVFAGRKKVIFVNGCFWHSHEGCKISRIPKSRICYWKPKLRGNKRRDKANQRKLSRMGWKYLTIWECEVKGQKGISSLIRRFLR